MKSGEKYTTCRLGDKTKRFKVWDKVKLCVGDRYHPRIIGIGEIVSVYIKSFKDINMADLIGESPDCKTKEGLRCTMYHIHKKILHKEIVTLISWCRVNE